VTTLILYSLVSVAVCYLAGRAKITRWAWSRYPAQLESFVLCTACMGTWLGAACGAFGWWRGVPFMGLSAASWTTVVASALACMVTTPLVAYLHLLALEALSTEGDEDVLIPPPERP
jgi:hypothetical protein